MDETVAKELQRLKQEIHKQKEYIRDIKKLVNKEIDREFPTYLWELSERELDTFLIENLRPILKYPKLRVEENSITSHRKILGKPIVRIKKYFLRIVGPYINKTLDEQTQFNRQSAVLYEALYLRLRHIKEKITQIEKKVMECEESLVAFLHKNQDSQRSLRQKNDKKANHKPTDNDSCL